ncbi:hypothetical protein [Micromonospora arida]|uniref:hypothetical protein n=1 Tax=Micromonospora arida TaxID=2203715 RepID=UPI0033B3272B
MGEVAGGRRTGRWWVRLRLPVGVAVGIATAAVEFAFLAVAAGAFSLCVFAPAASRRVAALTGSYGGRLVRIEHGRLTGLLAAADLPAPNAVATRRQVGYLLKDRVAQVDDFLDALDRVATGHAGSPAGRRGPGPRMIDSGFMKSGCPGVPDAPTSVNPSGSSPTRVVWGRTIPAVWVFCPFVGVCGW